ncbi:uncharacterized protein V6R79_005001 [Siganus canaliculatus]
MVQWLVLQQMMQLIGWQPSTPVNTDCIDYIYPWLLLLISDHVQRRYQLKYQKLFEKLNQTSGRGGSSKEKKNCTEVKTTVPNGFEVSVKVLELYMNQAAKAFTMTLTDIQYLDIVASYSPSFCCDSGRLSVQRSAAVVSVDSSGGTQWWFKRFSINEQFQLMFSLEPQLALNTNIQIQPNSKGLHLIDQMPSDVLLQHKIWFQTHRKYDTNAFLGTYCFAHLLESEYRFEEKHIFHQQHITT